jgi:hypothetical protein
MATSLKTQISLIGSALVNCSHGCAGISNNSSNGIGPRGLLLEERINAGGANHCSGDHIAEGIDREEDFGEYSSEQKMDGCVVVGLNPGKATDPERAYYRGQIPLSYASVEQLFFRGTASPSYMNPIGGIPYHKRLRKFVRDLGINGPILWTDVAKCENDPKVTLLPIQTLRVCADRFLKDELSAVPPDWPIIAVGQVAFNAVTYLATQRAVIGVPHPTGSRGQFHGLSNSGALVTTVNSNARNAIRTKSAVWLRATSEK